MKKEMVTRIIKFRGKRVDNGEWIYGSLDINFDGSCLISYWFSKLLEPENNFHEMTQEWFDVIPETVAQFTGMNDKNGMEIYEDDILKVERHQVSTYGYWSEQTTTVSFENGCFVHRSPNGFFNTLGNDNPIMEVIGNVQDKIEVAEMNPKNNPL